MMTNDKADKRAAPPAAAPEPPETKHGGFVHLAVQATTLGWNLVIPIVGGVLLGRYLDELFDKELTWTLSLLVLGVIVSFNNLYAMYIEHGKVPPPDGETARGGAEPKGDESHAKDQ